MPRRFDVLQAEMERETGHLLSQVDKGGLAFGVALDGVLLEGDALGGQIGHGSLHVVGLQADVAVDAAGLVVGTS